MSTTQPTPSPIARIVRAQSCFDRLKRISLSAIVIAFAVQAASASAKVVALNANADLHITSTHGSKINTEGTITGTFAGLLSVHVTLSSGSRMTATFVGKSHAGVLSGSVSAEYYPAGSVNIYSGSARISSGTGTYSHARADGIHVQGVMSRARRLISMHISGRLSE